MIARFGIFDQEQYLLRRRRGPQNDVEGMLWGLKFVVVCLVLAVLTAALVVGLGWILVQAMIRAFS